jgi:hypothetical protein
MKRRMRLMAAVGLVLLCAPAWSSEPVAYITEIQRGGEGAAFVTRNGETQPQPAQPLLVLRRGDEVRVSGGAGVVLLYHAGTGTNTVTRSNSPFIVQAPAVARPNDRLQVLVATVGQVFLNQQSAPVYRRLSVRSVEPAPPVPVLLSPRSTLIFPGPVTFEWTDSGQTSYGVRLFGSQGLVWEQRDVPRSRVVYPAGAPVLTEGVRYTWEVQTPGQPTQRSDFEIISQRDADRIRDALNTLKTAAREGYSPGTVPLMRAAVLLDEGLYADARRELQAAIESNRVEPAYHVLLGYIYQRIGLRAHAVDESERALTLSGPDAAASGR